VGGETPATVASTDVDSGLSPRGRGNPPAPGLGPALRRSIPVWAGKPRRGRGRCQGRGVYPRVGGETSGMRESWSWIRGLSPRGRGNPAKATGRGRMRRSIPAWAGKPLIVGVHARRIGVYPRVGGETFSGIPKADIFRGLSPRGRGNLPAVWPWRASEGSIPAWAGKPTAR